jgi:APA family basic amino acid/polyamine antiporter
LFTLVALVVGNMLGAGVFTTSGFALGDLGSPGYVLLAWLVGGLLALCGAISYGSLATLMPYSGGEYYFLSRGVHPVVGFIAGWISLWAGFTGAIAFAAITFEAYLLPTFAASQWPPNAAATLVILVAALAHGRYTRHGVVLQNLAVAMKLLFIGGFVAFCLLSGNILAWEGVTAARTQEGPAFSITAFALTLMWVSFSYSGFNASVYVASEVSDPLRDVPRSMILATLLITVLYLLLNAIFVYAPAPAVIAGQEDVAALAAEALAGSTLAGAMRAIILVALFTSVSAMMMAGPRVYAQMAEDGLMPRALRYAGQAPSAAIGVQALLAILLVWLTGLRELLSYLGFTLSLSAAITVASLFVAARRRPGDSSGLPGYPWAPVTFVCATGLFAVLAALRNPWEMLAALLTILSALLAYVVVTRGSRTRR